MPWQATRWHARKTRRPALLTTTGQTDRWICRVGSIARHVRRPTWARIQQLMPNVLP